MKKLSITLFVFVLALALVGSGSVLADQDWEGETLTVGVWGGPQEDLVRNYVIEPFEEDTGAEVELVLGGSSDRYARLYAEAENPTLDVSYNSLGQAQAMLKDGIIREPSPENVSQYDNLYELARQYGYGVSIMSIGVMYHTEEAEEPESWKDLWKPEYEGKVAPFVVPGTQGTSFLVMAARVHGGGVENIDPGFEAIKELRPFPAILSGIPETNQAFEVGDVWFTPQIHGYVYEARDEGFPVDFAIPEEGAPMAMNHAVVPANAENPELSEKFIDYHLKAPAQKAYAEELAYAPTNREVELPEELQARMPYGQEEIDELLVLDWAEIMEREGDWVERWEREVLR